MKLGTIVKKFDLHTDARAKDILNSPVRMVNIRFGGAVRVSLTLPSGLPTTISLHKLEQKAVDEIMKIRRPKRWGKTVCIPPKEFFDLYEAMREL